MVVTYAGLPGAAEPDAADRPQEADQRAAAAHPPLAHGRIRQAGQIPFQVPTYLPSTYPRPLSESNGYNQLYDLVFILNLDVEFFLFQ